MSTHPDIQREVARFVGQYYSDPLGFARSCYKWDTGPLKGFPGPCSCQVKILAILGEEIRKRKFDGVSPVKPIRIAVSSGHGIGKSALVAMLDNFIKSTRPGSIGTVTANTFSQLETKTWARIREWTKRCLTGPWFTVTSSSSYVEGEKESWFSAPQSCKEENSEAFAGQHAVTATSFYVFDEASAIPDSIFEVAEGGLTDGEPMIFLFGNPTRSTGKFFRVVFGSEKHRWRTVIIDSRDCPLSNKEQIAEWIEDYGEDSDFVRVRVRGLPPKASDSQFIPRDWVEAAQKRRAAVLPDEPLIAGCDLAWGGADFNTIRFRCGHDARNIPPIRVAGELTRDPSVMVMKLAEVLTQKWNGKKVHTLFLDSAGICGPVAARLRQMGYKNIVEVNFGSHSLNPKYAFRRSYMWGQLKEWLPQGSIDRDTNLEEDLTTPGYKLTNKTEILLEKKDQIIKRIGHSTDDGDALALTFAMPVKAPAAQIPRRPRPALGPYS